MLAKELAERLALDLEGDGAVVVTGVAPLEDAGAVHVSFVGSRKAAAQAAGSKAGVLIVPGDFPGDGSRVLLRSASPRTSFARAVAIFHPVERPSAGVHPSAVIGAGVELGDGVSVGPHVAIGDGSRIGARSAIGPGCVIGRRVTIGEDAALHSRVTLYDGVSLGSGVILHAGVTIGADGFGYAMESGKWEKFPQVGSVEIGDRVEIGAGSCVDRAALGVTRIGEGTKLDNLVHIGHNCSIGRHVVIAAQTGLSGGVTVGDYAVIGGQVGIGDKARIESKAVLGSGCGVLTSKIVRAGEPVWGTPARPLRKYLEQLASAGKVPEMRVEMEWLRRKIEALEAK
jgi:UDP-3-O-[3-hydroxymyristoyl] glucosamine N-acyltransferase